MSFMMRIIPPLLLGIAVLISTTPSASAHVPTYGTSTANNWGSVYGHGPTINVQLMGSLRGYTNMVTDYNNGRGHLNNEVDAGTDANPPFTNVLPGNSPTPDVFFVLAGSGEEAVINGAIWLRPLSYFGLNPLGEGLQEKRLREWNPLAHTRPEDLRLARELLSHCDQRAGTEIPIPNVRA